MNTTVRIKAKGKNYETIVDVDSALNFKKGLGNIHNVLQIDKIFHDVKKGLHVPESELQQAFGTKDIYDIAEKIVKQGEILLPQEYKKKEREDKLKQIIDFLSKNAIDPRTNAPHTAVRIEGAIEQVGINIDNRPVNEQINNIIEKLKTVLPLKLETKKIMVKVPASLTGKVYGLLNQYKEKEEWLNDGSLSCVVNLPVGLQNEFYDKLNSITHGAAITEEVKENA